ncbi:GNAT family N-acetyltransferase [uncultured Sphingomonas sp.]|uniref:GNAT family N-acetyltransferase n=1 Tax=Sphingomonas sp. TaxID=28214 RepID=UPI002628F99C|nr:N-acetyltransferase [uncultured Sphingomonas sp.]
MTTSPIVIAPLDPADAAEVEVLLDRAFGPGRHTRTAYKVRGDAQAIAELGFAAWEGERLIGSIQCWPIALVRDDGTAHPLVMVGPVAVTPERQRDGIGRRLVARALEAAAEHGLDGALMLIGDPEYYGRFFGFSAEHSTGWRLPGPVERHRLLARGGDVPDAAGLLGPRHRTPA